MAKLLDLRDFLPGNWHLTRIVKGFPRQEVVTMKGIASFIPNETGLTYKEKGDYLYQGQHLYFQQTYYYQKEKEAKYGVYFQDKRWFYALFLSNKTQKIQHLCGKDAYQGLFLWQSEDTWELCWQVKGPTKDFSIETLYERLKRF